MGIFVIIVVYYIVVLLLWFVKGLNLSNKPCEWCKKVKRGVRARDAYIKSLGCTSYRRMSCKFYLCNECAKGRSTLLFDVEPDLGSEFINKSDYKDEDINFDYYDDVE